MKAKLIKTKDGYHLNDLESGWWIGDTDHEKVKAHKGEQILSKLSIKNCQAIERGYDLEDLATDSADNYDASGNWHVAYELYKAGFQKALEILGDKRFTEGNIDKAIELGINSGRSGDVTHYAIDEFIQSLQQNEWEVEIVMEDVVGNLHETHHTNPTLSFPKQPIVYGERPKLDADGCLILKRVV